MAFNFTCRFHNDLQRHLFYSHHDIAHGTLTQYPKTINPKGSGEIFVKGNPNNTWGGSDGSITYRATFGGNTFFVVLYFIVNDTAPNQVWIRTDNSSFRYDVSDYSPTARPLFVIATVSLATRTAEIGQGDSRKENDEEEDSTRIKPEESN